MGSLFNKVLYVVLSIMLLMSLFPVYSVHASEEKNEDYFDKRIEQVEKTIKNKRDEILELKKSKDDVVIEKEDLELEIERQEKVIAETEKEIAKKEDEIEVVQDDIMELHQEIKEMELLKIEREDDFRDRISSIHGKGKSSFLDVVFSSSNLSDLLSSVFSYQVIVENDNKIIEEYLAIVDDLEKTKEEVETKLADLENRLSDLEDVKIDLEFTKNDLENLKKQKEMDILKVSDRIELSLSELDDYTTELSNLRVEREEWIKAEEERKKREAAERKAKEELEKMLKSSNVSVNHDIIKSVGKSTFIIPSSGRLTSAYGPRWGRNHDGIDLGTPIGTAVYASAGGKVTFAGNANTYGNLVKISHTINGINYETRYAHLNSIGVKVGQTVSQGDIIALSGNTGRSTGPHLHFEILVNGKAVDPMPFLNFK